MIQFECALAARLHCLVVWQSFERFLAVPMCVTSLRLNEYARYFRMGYFNPAFDARHGFFHFCRCIGVNRVQAQRHQHVLWPKVHRQDLIRSQNGRLGGRNGINAGLHGG